MNRLLKRVRVIALVALVALAGWLGWQQFGGQQMVTRQAPEGNLAGSTLGGAFSLVNQDGEALSEADFKGQWRLMYFGYTFCPDVCPTDMAVIGRAMATFEGVNKGLAATVTPIFITVDPARDVPVAIKPFVRAFHPRFVGLTGSEAQVAAAMKTFGIYARKVETRESRDAANRGEAANYLVDHFAVFYLFGPDGQPVAFLPHGSEAGEVATMLETYVR